MLAAPLLVGVLGGGASWWHLLLTAAWFLAYFSFNATGLWLKARRRPRYFPPVRAYAIALAAVGIPLLVLDPHLLWWAPVFAPLLGVGLWCSWARRDRSLLNDGATVLAACLMLVVAWQLGEFPFAAPTASWAWAGVLWVYFFGTAFYVKTMIRERGNPVMLRVSIGYHAVAAVACLALAWPCVGAWSTIEAWSDAASGSFGWRAYTPALGLSAETWLALAVFFALLTLRAWLVPAKFPRATPKQLGIGEIVATVALVSVFLVAS